LTDIVAVQCERTKTLKEMAERSRYFYEDVVLSDEMKTHFTPELMPVLKQVRDKLAQMPSWTKEAIHEALASTAEAVELKLGKLAQPIRIAMTGGTVSPPIDMTMQLLGRDCVIARLNNVLL
jgi:glutamyl-tRNA synthetase